MGLKREVCKVCGDIVRVGFRVPNDIWNAAVPAQWLDSSLCLSCFTRLADEARISWADRIEFYPVDALGSVDAVQH